MADAGAIRAGKAAVEATWEDSKLSAGMATARENATGKTFQFKIEGAATKLKAGDKVFANFATRQVSVDGAEPCCTIKQ